MSRGILGFSLNQITSHKELFYIEKKSMTYLEKENYINTPTLLKKISPIGSGETRNKI